MENPVLIHRLARIRYNEMIQTRQAAGQYRPGKANASLAILCARLGATLVAAGQKLQVTPTISETNPL